ncbi:LacI family DNA-binding transcriptional regulator [Edaphobacter sp. 12200R-103]|jgi:LacI family transcriptional regulator|uniref:LacI family DNA-binding transcriptional regulator n=1 Tax=Edaphobacter sp. 12200R-103 TaxID=2703788 RepID=UPI00138C720E|nr:LacI family DNA-binding transcriptional regulator [Edaphobacter sp. 12200R-103]QHS51356.1 substrate-binding domain-containing protein [Edaphobacter sp. 12200R-103]
MALEPKQVGIKEIARVLKISIGTVDRALHNRSGVSEKTKSKVLQMASELGYRPNLAAQALKLNRRISIAAVLPKHISYFFDPLRAGIAAAADAAVRGQIAVDFIEYPRLGAGDEEALQKAIQGGYNGIIVLPGKMQRYSAIMRKLAREGIATMCVGSDAPASERIGSVGVDAYVSGAIAAEILSLRLNQKANVVVFSGELSLMDHAEKLRGFAATIAVQAPHLTLLPALESHEQPREAYRQTLELMRRRNRPEGLYLSTANSQPVLQALDELNLLDKIHIVTTDLYKDLIPLIEYGKVLATIHQRPFTQGKLAFENLVRYLLQDDEIHRYIRLAPHIVLRSNLALFSENAPASILGTEEEQMHL